MKRIFVTILVLAIISLVISLSLTLGRRNNAEYPTVETNVGTFRGLEAQDGEYFMFMGIPYAAVNESNPFGTSSPYPALNQTYEAYDDSAVCPQRLRNGTIAGSLDCLRLNIYVPNTANPTNKLPVLVWIYGGAFMMGFYGRESAGPRFLIKHNVILVMINYRVGPYGFMCLDIPEVPGNQGLKDQLLALKWINNNIETFNGDKEKITLMGESAGAMSTGFHIISKHENLFHQAILKSGSELVPYVVRVNDNTTSFRIASHLGFVANDQAEAIAFLATKDSGTIIAVALGLSLQFRPCVEREFENVESILTVHPEFLDVPKVRNMSILAGYNSHENGNLFASRDPKDFEGLDVFYNELGETFDVANDFDNMTNIVQRFYIGDEPISKEVVWGIVDFSSDMKFSYPVQRTLLRYLRNGAKNVYQYLFSYKGGRNTNHTVPGAVHSDTLGYIFERSFFPEEPSVQDQLTIDRLTTMFTNFVKYGDPTPEVSDLLPVRWLPIAEDAVNYIHIDSELTVSKRPQHSRFAFLDLFFKTNYDKLVAHWDVFNIN